MSDYDFKADRKEKLERRLATARRVAALPVDPLTKERVDGFIQELEVELGEGSAGIEAMVSWMDLSGTRCSRCRSRATVQSAIELRPGRQTHRHGGGWAADLPQVRGQSDFSAA